MAGGDGVERTARWTTALSSKVNLIHAINIRAVCGSNLVTLPCKWQVGTRSSETLQVNVTFEIRKLTIFTGELP